jgi:FSR family fosmidomycin resistance protein-like MFS transporter
VNATIAPVSVRRAPGLDRRGLGALALGHLGADLCQGTIPALLPFLVHQRGLSYSAASALVLVMTATSSLLQPLFGHVADRRGLPSMAPPRSSSRPAGSRSPRSPPPTPRWSRAWR